MLIAMLIRLRPAPRPMVCAKKRAGAWIIQTP
jgi:hypothetical protein